MALVGDNGAGKSTLIKCIAGIYPFDEGAAVFDGEEVNIHGPKDAARLGIEVVYQDLALADNLDVVQNMYLGREEVDGLRRLDETTMEARPRRRSPSLSVTTHQLGSPDRGRSLRRPAPVGRRRQGRDVELARGDPRRADRRARRGADPPGARPRQAARRAGPRGDPDLAQPARHLRGRRLDHGPAARPERGRVQAHGDQPAGGRRGHHVRQALEGARPGRSWHEHGHRAAALPRRPAPPRRRSARTRAAGGRTSSPASSARSRSSSA